MASLPPASPFEPHDRRAMKRISHTWSAAVVLVLLLGLAAAITQLATGAANPRSGAPSLTRAPLAAAGSDAGRAPAVRASGNSQGEGQRRHLLSVTAGEARKASTYHYERDRPPLWGNNADAARSLHPTIIGIGVQKSGTTALSYFLKHLKGVDTGAKKEEHYFDRTAVAHYDPDAALESGNVLRDYLAYLEQSWPRAARATACEADTMQCTVANSSYSKVTIDMSPSYISDRRVPWVMHEILPHASTLKLLLILREPVARTLSGLFQACPSCNDTIIDEIVPRELSLLEKCYNSTASFGAGFGTTMAHLPSALACSTGHAQMRRLHACVREDIAVDDKPWFGRFTLDSAPDMEAFRGRIRQREDPYQGVLFRSVYVDGIKNYLCAGFRPEQFLIMTSNELHADMEAAVGRIARFVGRTLQPRRAGLFRSADYSRNSRSSGHASFDPALRGRMEAFFRPYNEALLELLLNNAFDVERDFLIEEFTQY